MRMTTMALAAACAVLAGCEQSDQERGAREEELVLRSYSAPGQADSLANGLAAILRLGDQRVGSARVGAGDQILVLAPRSVHEDLEEVVQSHVRAGNAATPPVSISMTYWFIGARPTSISPPLPANLTEIGSALEQVAVVQGPQEFRLIERMQLRQSPRHDEGGSQAKSPAVSLLQVVSYARGEVVAFVRALPAGDNEIKTTVRLRPDQLLVLGQVGLDAALDPFPQGEGSDDRLGLGRSLYLVIRADVEPPA